MLNRANAHSLSPFKAEGSSGTLRSGTVNHVLREEIGKAAARERNWANSFLLLVVVICEGAETATEIRLDGRKEQEQEQQAEKGCFFHSVYYSFLFLLS